jgi:hypothetical protein
MRTPAAAALLAFTLLPSARAHAEDSCKYDRAAMLALDEKAFDQDLSHGGGGWRALQKPGCLVVAADLIRDYRAAHPGGSNMLAWHEGQMRAFAGKEKEAIALFDAARRPADMDLGGWNLYVDASIAFLKHDKPAVVAARASLAHLQYPGGDDLPPVKDGYIDIPADGGRPAMRMPWPPNIDIVDAFLKCFDKSYNEVYNGGRCRVKPPAKHA